MIKTIAVLPDGSTLSSGEAGAVVESFTLTQSVNSGQELTLGSVCAAMAELSVLSPQGLSLKAGDELTLYRTDGESTCKIGVFIAQEPERKSVGRLKITAYDRVTRLDCDLSGWIEELTEWPYTLGQFSQMVCARCGVALKACDLPNGDYQIPKFQAGQVTGRQLMQWIGELSGRFCRADRDGNLEFAWYTPREITITPGGEHYYFQGQLHYGQYQVEPIGKVQLRQNDSDVGTVYPNDPEAVNTYSITANPLLTADSASSLIGIAQTLYEQLHAVSYTPCKVAIATDCTLAAGDIVTVQAADGAVFSMYVMTRIQQGSRDTLEATGSQTRSSTSAVNNRSLQALSGKVLNLKTTVDGLQAENRDAAGKIASLELTVAGISSEVSRQQTEGHSVKTQLTALTQKAEAVELNVQKLTEDGASRVQTQTGFTFDDRGLTICKSSSQMENLLDETGMYVRRSGKTILQANQDGVEAVDVTVRNYLVVGEHARFEDYSSGADTRRTACYWI